MHLTNVRALMFIGMLTSSWKRRVLSSCAQQRNLLNCSCGPSGQVYDVQFAIGLQRALDHSALVKAGIITCAKGCGDVVVGDGGAKVFRTKCKM